MWSRLALFFGIVVCSLSSPTGRNRPIFPLEETIKWIRYEGYAGESHNVETHDGYILELHRIPYGQFQTTSTSKRPVVFMMHGLMAASNCYILLGPQKSLAFNFADAGFDVWLGNARGNKLSRRHVKLNPDSSKDKRQFFDLSFEEIGMYDVAQMIDYVLEYTDSEQLHYIGHSQGGTAFLVLTSMLPEYNAKFASVNLLAGVGYQNYFPNTALRTLARFTNTIYTSAVAAGFVEVAIPSLPNITRPDSDDDPEQELLYDLMSITEMMRDDTIEDQDYTNMFGGAALKQIAHFGQNIRDKTFRRWNYGAIRNRQIYGSSTPPAYDLSLITANVTMHYTVSDILLDERDVLAMVNDMPNARARKVPREDFSHLAFVSAADSKELLTDYILEATLRIENLRASDSSAK
ncbi:lipase 3-like isoform X2 [Galleria mellonella]|uniref:Lipase n=1 Tax=Galleria mellonella TaxID=7137 RepID=A0A6J1X0T5_GALME|nr:lipase 3-like isoform X2 [Galleria mellonella]